MLWSWRHLPELARELECFTAHAKNLGNDKNNRGWIVPKINVEIGSDESINGFRVNPIRDAHFLGRLTVARHETSSSNNEKHVPTDNDLCLGLRSLLWLRRLNAAIPPRVTMRNTKQTLNFQPTVRSFCCCRVATRANVFRPRKSSEKAQK